MIQDVLNNYLEDIKNNKAIIFSYEDIEEVRSNLLQQLQRFMLGNIEDVVENNHGKLINNSLKDMEDSKYKISPSELLSLFVFVGQQKNKQIPKPTINGRTSEWFLPEDISPRATGFIASSLFSGMKFPEYIFHVKESAIPQIVNVTTGTSVTGHMGRKLVKFLELNVVDYYKMVVNNGEIILPSANILKISGKIFVE